MKPCTWCANPNTGFHYHLRNPQVNPTNFIHTAFWGSCGCETALCRCPFSWNIVFDEWCDD